MHVNSGTYIIILQCHEKKMIQIGRWGMLETKPGYYLYIGSAFGPGGVKARVSRHFRNNKKKHWHIDYLREYLTPISVWYNLDKQKLEHEWANIFMDMPNSTPIKHFGCSDCQCFSHLFTTMKKPDFTNFSERAKTHTPLLKKTVSTF